MTEEATFQIKIKVGNKNQFKKDIQRMLDESGYLGSNVKKVRTAGAAGGAGGGASGYLGTMMGSMSKMLGAAGVALMILSQFKSITSIASAILRTAIEFLRPIADVITLLLMPVLMILRPILMIVRQMMAPFRKSAYQLAALGSKLIKNGDVTGGLGLFGQAILTILAGFVPILTTWWGTLLKFVVDIGAGMVKMISGVIFDVAALIARGMDAIAGFFGIKTKLEDGVRDTQAKFDKGIDDAAQTIKNKIDENIKSFNETFTEWVIGAAKKSIEAAEAQLEAADKMKQAADKYLNMAPGTSYFGTANKEGDIVKSDGSKVKNESSLGLKEGAVVSQLNNEFYVPIEDVVEKAGTQMTTFTDTVKAGFVRQNDIALTYVGPGGTIPQTYTKGFDSVKASMTSFTKAMQSAATGISGAINTALAAGKKAVSEAEKYARALRALEAKRS